MRSYKTHIRDWPSYIYKKKKSLNKRIYETFLFFQHYIFLSLYTSIYKVLFSLYLCLFSVGFAVIILHICRKSKIFTFIRAIAGKCSQSKNLNFVAHFTRIVVGCNEGEKVESEILRFLLLILLAIK